METLSGASLDLTEYNLHQLKELFPEVFCEDKIDFDKFRLLLGDNVEDREEGYEFTWNGKSDAIRLAQTPSTGTLRPDRESSKNWDDTENLYIEGDNLEVLKLLQKSYFGKVKLIYIDPPYNTGKDFVYKDNFRDNIANYKEITNQSTRANPETNGRYHTDWLNMMYPRLKLARNLLKEDGVILISLDDCEIANLKKICDEVFGEENFVNDIIWHKKYGAANDAKYLSDVHDHLLLYCKSKVLWRPNLFDRPKELNAKYKNPDNDPRGPWIATNMSVKTYSVSNDYEITSPAGLKFNPPPTRCWIFSNERYQQMLKDNRITFGVDGTSRPYLKTFLSEVQNGIVPTTVWSYNDAGHNIGAKSEIRDLFNETTVPFDTPKPTKLIKRILKMTMNSNNDIILDFFSGSATSADALMQYNNECDKKYRYIMVQIPEICKKNSQSYKAGYKNICEIGKERIRRAGDRIVSENKDKEEIENLDIGFKVFKLDSSNLKSWDSSVENLEQNVLNMDTNLKKDRTNEDLLYEILLKSGIELTSKIEKIKVGYNTVYNIGEGALLACLDDKITQDVIDEIPKHKSEFMETKVIFKEAGFMSDAAKINAIQNLKQFKIEDVRSV